MQSTILAGIEKKKHCAKGHNNLATKGQKKIRESLFTF